MLIVADENMPYVREWFAPFGVVHTVPGRSLNPELLREADALLVRSVTHVNCELLRDSCVRFVGTATSGIEHIDTNYLEMAGIAFAAASGCNATAVVEYVLSSICALEGVFEKLLAGGVVGVVGLGNVGARLVKRLQTLGIRCVGYDPFVSAASGLPLCDWDSVLQADVVCCHTPLTKHGEYPTWHLFDIQRLRKLRSDTVLINAGRGAVVDNVALKQLLSEREDIRVVLDVWESEPDIDLSLLDAVALATPHIAGYSWDGKVAGTRAVLAAFCKFFGFPLIEPITDDVSPRLHFSPHENSEVLLRSAVQSVYDVRDDDRELRAALSTSTTVAETFDRLRKNYPQRREIAAYAIENWKELSAKDQSLLQRLGFSANNKNQ